MGVLRAVLRPGETVAGRLVVEREAGIGGMGRVYRAHEGEQTVALKVLHAVDGASRERFEREARILSALSHPAIVGYVDHGEHDGQPFIAMDWLEGEPLSVRLRRGPLALADAADLSATVADALACAHEAGVLHVEVGDDGAGGASLSAGTGLAGVARRLAPFDGTLTVSSPAGGPTVVRMEVPCALSSPRTSPSSGTD